MSPITTTPNPDLRELHSRLLRRPNWHPARYPGTCVNCGQKVARNQPVTLLRTENGPRWTCSCVFLPTRTLVERVEVLRRADQMTRRERP